MTARFSSASAYLLDAFLVAFVLLFLEGGGAIPLALIWLALTFVTALAAVLISWRKPYKPLPAIFTAIIIMAIALAAGVTVGIFIVLTIISLYRLHARFSEIEDGSEGEGSFLVVFILTMTFALIITLVNPATDPQNLIWALSAAAIVFYTVTRLMFRYLDARKDGAKLWHGLAAGGGIVFVSGMATALVYLFAPEVRHLAGRVVNSIIAVVLWPFAGLYDEFGKFIAREGQNMSNSGGDPEPPPSDTQLFQDAETLEFDYTIGTAIVVLLLLIGGILLIRKIRKDTEEKAEESAVETSRFTAQPEAPVEPAAAPNYDMVDIHEIRRAFRKFEGEVAAVQRGRLAHETIREWAKREEVPVSETFFRIYDKVRYGRGGIAANEAFPFLEELEKIKMNLFKENV
ncbi:hypothetical protein [Metaplanococcus flavidus]|uniref:DUF4129 domain-containing protein n=1 Tax=Metaplanococcus flavidus TaxID=569883 RepID=A0ABW3LBR3_9BACL